MGRRPIIPAELKARPFSLDEARGAGLSLRSLSGSSWRRIGAGLYQWAELPDDPWLTLDAWRRVLPTAAAFAGRSAAWLYGLDLQAMEPVEIVVPPTAAIRTRPGLVVRHMQLAEDEIVSVRGLRALRLPLMLAGLSLYQPAVEALIAIDMAIQRRLTSSLALTRGARAARGRAGMARLASLASVAGPAESPMETRLRWLLLESGLPRPEVQVDLRDGAARFVGRADIYYREAALVLEYDGGNHRDRLVEDDRRQNLIVSAGYRMLRFTAADLRDRPDAVVAQVRAALGPRFVRSARKPRKRRSKGSFLRKTYRILATARSGFGSAGRPR